MLKRIQLLYACHVQAALHSMNVLVKKPFHSLLTIIVIAIVLTLPALFWVLHANLYQLTQSWHQQGALSVYLKPGMSQAEIKAVWHKVSNMPQVKQATLKTAEQGLAELTQQEGMHDIMDYLPENPLPAVIQVVLFAEESKISSEEIPALIKKLDTLPEIAQVQLDMAWFKRLQNLLKVTSYIVHIIWFFLALAVILIIGNTLRLAVQNRLEEIQILKLIGATDSFILRPFLYMGVWYGLTGALLAALFVDTFIVNLNMILKSLLVDYQIIYKIISMSIRQILILIVFGVILGWLGAWLSVKGQLSAIEVYI